MSLAALQQDFMGQVLADTATLPPRWDARMAAGFDVYRNAYRATLVEALRETFPRTVRWVGDEAFAQAAAHHVIMHPPGGWTLDLVGEGFVETLEELFVRDPDVADLAWLEWAMHLAFTARDAAPVDAAGFAVRTSAFGEDDWAAMRLTFLPSLAVRGVTSDCTALWRALADNAPPVSAMSLGEPGACIVWREGLTPVFRLAGRLETLGLTAMTAGGTFGDLCAVLQAAAPDTDVAASAGAMLGKWLAEGLVLQPG